MVKNLLLVFGLVIIAAVVVSGYYFFLAKQEAGHVSRDGTPLTKEQFEANEKMLAEGRQLSKDAEYEEAANLFEEIASGEMDGVYTSEQIADARRSTIFRYRVTGEAADSLEAVRDLKASILDKSISDRQRAMSLNTLATSHCWFARDEEVIKEIFSGDKFSKYYRADINQSVHDMLLWSMDIYQTPKAASTLAYWYADQVLKNDYVQETLSPETRAAYIAGVVRYASLADSLAEKEMQRSPEYRDRQHYVGYLYRNAIAKGFLAVVGELSVEEFEATFATLFSEQARQNSHNGSGYVPFGYIWKAQYAALLNQGTDEVQKNLLAAVTAIENDPVPQANEVVDYIADKASDTDGRYSWHAIQSLRKVSPEFNEFVTEVEQDNP